MRNYVEVIPDVAFHYVNDDISNDDYLRIMDELCELMGKNVSANFSCEGGFTFDYGTDGEKQYRLNVRVLTELPHTKKRLKTLYWNYYKKHYEQKIHNVAAIDEDKRGDNAIIIPRNSVIMGCIKSYQSFKKSELHQIKDVLARFNIDTQLHKDYK